MAGEPKVQYKGFWERPDFQSGQVQAAKDNEVRLPTIAESQETGDTAHKNAFWKNPEWQKKQAAAAAENKDKWMAGSGQVNWGDSGAPPEGIYYRTGEGQSGWKE